MNTRRTVARACLALCTSLPLIAAAAPDAAAPAASEDPVVEAVRLMRAEDVPLVRLQSIVVNGVEQAKIGLDQRLPADKVAPVMADITATASKTMNEVVPIVHDAGVKLAPSVVGKVLRDNFNDEEMRQLVALLNSPVRKKYEALLPKIQDAIGQAVTEQTQAQVNPKLQEMGKAISARIATALITK